MQTLSWPQFKSSDTNTYARSKLSLKTILKNAKYVYPSSLLVKLAWPPCEPIRAWDLITPPKTAMQKTCFRNFKA